MNNTPDFSHIIDLALQRKQMSEDESSAAKRAEEQRVSLNREKVREVLDGAVLPVFQAAAEQLQRAGCYVRVDETRGVVGTRNSVCLVAALRAGILAVQPPQCFATLSYEGDSATLAFKCSADGEIRLLSIDQVTAELVAQDVAEFLGAKL